MRLNALFPTTLFSRLFTALFSAVLSTKILSAKLISPKALSTTAVLTFALSFVFGLMLPQAAVAADVEANAPPLSSSLPSPPEQTTEQLLILAENDDARAQFELGNFYLNADNELHDLEQALYWYTRSGEQGNFNAQYNLAVIYTSGQGVIADQEEAVRWFRLAAEQGDIVSQYSLGAMYANGKGVSRDLALAYKWFGLAAASGDRNAQANLVLFQEMMSYEQIIEGQALVKQWIEDFQQRH